jgi:hypothetical protein
MEFNFNWKYKDYELRMTTSLHNSKKYLELVKWHDYKGKDSCYTLAYFTEDSAGYELKFAGSRPFEDIEDEDVMTVWHALQIADTALNSYWKHFRNVQG